MNQYLNMYLRSVVNHLTRAGKEFGRETEGRHNFGTNAAQAARIEALDEPLAGWHRQITELTAEIAAYQQATKPAPKPKLCKGCKVQLSKLGQYNLAEVDPHDQGFDPYDDGDDYPYKHRGWRKEYCASCCEVEKAEIARAVAEGDQDDPTPEEVCSDCGREDWQVVNGLCGTCRIVPLTPAEQAALDQRAAIQKAYNRDDHRRRMASWAAKERGEWAEKAREEAEQAARIGGLDGIIIMMSLKDLAGCIRADGQTETVRKELRKIHKEVKGRNFDTPMGQQIREQGHAWLKRVLRFLAAFPRTDGVKDGDRKLVEWVRKIEIEIYGAATIDLDVALAVETGVDWDAELRRMDGDE